MQFKVIKCLMLLLLLLSGLCSYAKEGADLNDLDEVLKKAGSLNAFLESKTIQQEYYDVATEYYGHKFSISERQESYWVILEQMKKAVKKNPALAEKLWSTEDLGRAFEIDSKIADHGVDIYIEKYQNAWKVYIGAERKKIADIDNKAIFIKEEAKKISSWVENEKSKIEYEYKNSILPKAQRDSVRGQSYAKLQNDLLAQKNFQKLSAALLEDLSQRESFVDTLRTGDANIILDFLDKFRTKGANTFAIQGIESSLENLHPYIVKSIPKELIQPLVPKLIIAEGKANETKFFVVKTKEVKVRDAQGQVVSTKLIPQGTNSDGLKLKPIPRRFHGVFKGLELGECVAGGSCDLVSIERWAVPTLEGSHHYYVEAGDQYKGWVSLFPGEVNGQKVSNIEFGANVLNQSQEYKGKPYPLYEHVMSGLKDRMPKGTNGFLVGDSNAIDNANVIGKVQNSNAYNAGIEVSKKFVHKDQKILRFLIGERKRQKQSNKYGYAGKGIIDANQSEEFNVILNDKFILNEEISAEDLKKLIAKSRVSPVGLYFKSRLPFSRSLEILAKPENIVQPGAIEAIIEQANIGHPLAKSILTRPENLDHPKVFKAVKKMARKSNDNAIKALSNAKYANNKEVTNILVDLAKKGNSSALSALSNERYLEQPKIWNVFIKAIEKENSMAMTTLGKAPYIEHPKVWDTFIKAAEKGNYYALRALREAPYIEQPKVFDIFIDQIQKGNDRALQAMLPYIEHPKVWDVFIKAAEKGNYYALSALSEAPYIEQPKVFDIFIDQIQKGNAWAAQSMRTYIEQPRVWDAFLKAANKGDVSALIVLRDPPYIDRPGVLDVIIRQAEKGSMTAILNLTMRENLSRPGVLKALKNLKTRDKDDARTVRKALELAEKENIVEISTSPPQVKSNITKDCLIKSLKALILTRASSSR